MVKSEPVTPLDRPKATESLGGLVEPEPLPCLLIGINATVSFGDLADLNHRHTYWGAWSCPTMVTPSDQLSKACFCKRFLSLPLLPYFFYDYSSIFVVFPLNQQHFFTGSADGNRFICTPEKYARFNFPVNIMK